MSRRPSKKPPPPSTAVGSDGEASAQARLAAGAVLAERGVFGFLWLDAELVVRARYGRLVDFVMMGERVGDSLLPLLTFDAEIEATRAEPGRVFDVPSVSIMMPDAPRGRLNLTVMWMPESQQYLVLVSRAQSRSDLEQHLIQETRGRLMAEADARALATQLTRANRDLEEFASIISHDLRAPMRAMRYLTEDAQTALGATDMTVLAQKLGQIGEQARRLSSMLNALFEYSRAGYKQDVVEHVDTYQLVCAIVRSLPERAGVRILVKGAWPGLDTLAAPLDLVVRNLIDNAIKHHDRAEMEIVVSAEDQADLVVIDVSDDGPGIDPKHHAAILLPFRTLSPAPEANSSGMGLAVVTRTLETVGGQLQVHSDPGRRRGTTFRVLWPKTIEQHTQPHRILG